MGSQFSQDELLWAAAWLYKASGDNSYLNYAASNDGWSQAVSEFSWDNKFAGAQTLLSKACSTSLLRRIRQHVNLFYNTLIYFSFLELSNM